MEIQGFAKEIVREMLRPVVKFMIKVEEIIKKIGNKIMYWLSFNKA
jgi:hypothetical protein